MTTRWVAPNVLDVISTWSGRSTQAVYEVSSDGRTMTVTTAEQRIVLERI